MPELPEVETVRRALQATLAGHKITSASFARPDLRFALPDGLGQMLTGAHVERIGRRAKFLLFELDNGYTLLSHLGMSGRYVLEQEAPDATAAPGPSWQPGHFVHPVGQGPARAHQHDHVVLRTQDGLRVIYHDPRRFGYMDLFETRLQHTNVHLAHLGPEPLDAGFDSQVLMAALGARRTSIKAALLDQTLVAGLGNIYVCEALARVGLHPARAAASLTDAQGARLVEAIRTVLTQAIAEGGSTLRDFAAPDGALGYFPATFAVYGRQGEACRTPDCPGTVERIVQAGRSSFFCGSCQT